MLFGLRAMGMDAFVEPLDKMESKVSASLSDARQAEQKGQGKPAQPQPESQTESREWNTYYDRKQEREDRGEWGTAGTNSQYARWQERWNAAQEDDGGVGRGKWKQW